jgi:hypothetical protein
MKENKFYEFTEQLKEGLYREYGQNVKIDIHETTKNNGTIYHAVAIMENGSNISPNVRLDGFFRSFMEGTQLSDIVKEIVQIYEMSKSEKIDLSFFTDFSKAKHQIMFRIVGYDRNKVQLQKMPHIKFLDLALTFYLYLDLQDAPERRASIQIEQEHLKMWGIDTGTLFDLAMENTIGKMPVRCQSIYDVILTILKRDGIRPGAKDAEMFRNSSQEVSMYVLSNQKNYFGASVIYYPGVLKKLAEQIGRDLIVLPSSIHEVILTPVRGEEDYDEINQMIRDINRDEVDEEEVLSDHLYYYDAKRDELRIPVFEQNRH